MSSSSRRWSWLTVFALCNLGFWVVVAAAVGLAVSDKLDLGVEALIREWQATVVASWTNTSVGTLEPKAKLPLIATSQTVQEKPTTSIVWPDPTISPSPSKATTTSLPLPQATATLPPPQEKSKAQPTESSQGSSSIQPEKLPTQSLNSTPLLMADPGLEGLLHIDAEMSHSTQGRAVQIRYQEEALNREITTLLESYPDLPYRNIKVELQRDRVVVTGDVTLLGIEVNTKVQGQVVAQDCLPQVEIENISIADIVAPGFFKDQIKELIGESLSWYPADYPLCLEQIVLEDGRVTIYGARR
jgi:hypothetical protein